MKTTISKLYEFEAAHRLSGLPATHQCHHLHGHSYKVRVTLTAKTFDEDIPWIVDFATIDSVMKPLIARVFDHHYLNDTLGSDNTTAEFIAAYIWKTLQAHMLQLNQSVGREVNSPDEVFLVAVRVHETAKCYAEVTA